MKNYNPKSFALGIIFTFAIISIFSFTENKNTSSEAEAIEIVQGIDPAQALNYRNNYQTLYPSELKGVNISLQQWEAINQLMSSRNNNTSNLSGFRLYYGSTGTNRNSEIVSLAYSINSGMSEDDPGSTVNMAQGFSRSFSQQCPPFCD
jgi:hypothetical protein